MELRPYEVADAAAVVAVWNAAMPSDFSVDRRLLVQNTTSNPHYQTGDAIVAGEDGRIVGFGSCRVACQPLGTAGLQPDRGWISVLLVHPEFQCRGIGSHILTALRARLGERRVLLGGDPGHFFPGIPKGCTAAFFERRGFMLGPARAWDLRRSLEGWELPPHLDDIEAAAGVRIAECTDNQVPALHAFFAETFPGRWHHDVTQRLALERGPQDILVVSSGDRVVGFSSTFHAQTAVVGPSIFWRGALGPTAGGLGPIGVSETLRGKGIGLALVFRSMQHVQGHGARAMGIDWTVLLDFYRKAGFEPYLEYTLSA